MIVNRILHLMVPKEAQNFVHLVVQTKFSESPINMSIGFNKIGDKNFFHYTNSLIYRMSGSDGCG